MPRDERWFDELATLIELERKEARARLEANRQSLPLEELEARGVVVLDLEAVEEDVGLGGRWLLTFERGDRRALSARLSPGELVELRPRKAEWEPTAPSGVVSRATATRVEIAFDRTPPQFVREGRLRLDRVPNEVTFDRARSGVMRLKAQEKGRGRRTREVVLGRESARFDDGKVKGESLAGARLNPEQREAAVRALCAEDLFLVHGPPGTGKSTVLAEVAVQAVARGERLLCTAMSNAAVDHLLDLCLARGLKAVRVGHPARVSERLQAHTLDLLVEAHPDRQLSRELFDEAHALLGYARRQRTQGRSRERFHNARTSKAEAGQLFDEARKLERKAVDEVLSRADVICATLTMLESSLLAPDVFDLALLDEATQAIEPLALLAFLKAPKVVLAGDHRQLPPTVLSRAAQEKGLGRSLFERLLDEHGDGVKQMLREQYRMHEAIMAFPSAQMYAGALRAHPSVATRALSDLLSAPLEAPPLLYVDTAGKGFDEGRAEGEESLSNEGEAELLVARAVALLQRGLPPRELALITPYRAQAALLRERLTAAAGTTDTEDAGLAARVGEVEVDTVDAFQGREKEAVLVSLVRSNAAATVGFLADTRRMNVALTRGKRHLFVVGDSATLSAHPFYAAFVEHAQQTGAYRSAWEWASE